MIKRNSTGCRLDPVAHHDIGVSSSCFLRSNLLNQAISWILTQTHGHAHSLKHTDNRRPQLFSKFKNSFRSAAKLFTISPIWFWLRPNDGRVCVRACMRFCFVVLCPSWLNGGGRTVGSLLLFGFWLWLRWKVRSQVRWYSWDAYAW